MGLGRALFQGAVVITDTRLSVNLNLINAPRPMAAAVSGSQSSVAPSARFVTRSPRCGVPSQCSCSPLKSYLGASAHHKHP